MLDIFNFIGDVVSSNATITPTARIHRHIYIHTDIYIAMQEKADLFGSCVDFFFSKSFKTGNC